MNSRPYLYARRARSAPLHYLPRAQRTLCARYTHGTNYTYIHVTHIVRITHALRALCARFTTILHHRTLVVAFLKFSKLPRSVPARPRLGSSPKLRPMPRALCARYT